MKIHGRITGLFLFILISGCRSAPATPGPTGDQPPETLPITGTTPTPTPPTHTDPTPTATPVATATPHDVPSLAASLGIQESIDLRQFDGPIMNQFGGTCSAFATAAAMNNVLKQKGINKLVSERHLWSLYGVYDMDYAISAAKKYYVTEEQYWPVSGNKSVNFQDYASLKILQTKQDNYNMESALQGLSAGHPLVMAIQVPADLSNCKATISATSSRTSGQHVVEAVGYHLDDSVSGGGYFIIKNSWGTSCGDKGYHYYPFGLCKRSDLYCYFAEVIDVDSR